MCIGPLYDASVKSTATQAGSDPVGVKASAVRAIAPMSRRVPADNSARGLRVRVRVYFLVRLYMFRPSTLCIFGVSCSLAAVCGGQQSVAASANLRITAAWVVVLDPRLVPKLLAQPACKPFAPCVGHFTSPMWAAANNSFKPTPRRGLTQVLELMQIKSITRSACPGAAHPRCGDRLCRSRLDHIQSPRTFGRRPLRQPPLSPTP